MQELAPSVLQYIRRHDLIRTGDRVGLAVSGGADSVALVRLMLELRGELGVGLCLFHFNHQLRGADSDADEQFVKELATSHKLQFHSAGEPVKAYAAAQALSIEAAARHLRYGYFSGLVRAGMVNRIATAHTLDDQAETVLLRVVRGSGTAGLAGIYPRVLVSESAGSIVRPLLGVRRKQIESYLNQLQQPWREDLSNRDLRHTRNRVRHGIMPRLERHLNPSIRESLADVAEIARTEEEYWQKEVSNALPEVMRDSGAIRLNALRKLPLALQRRVLRAAAKNVGLRLEFRHVENALDVCEGQKKSAPMPQGWSATRLGSDEFRFAVQAEEDADYESVLKVPGAANIETLGVRFEAVLLSDLGGYPAEHLFDEALLNKELRVRNWRAGDRFWPAHTKAPKKIKELLQDRHVTGAEKKLWPVVAHGQDVLWMRGFPRPAAWQCGHRSTTRRPDSRSCVAGRAGVEPTQTYDPNCEGWAVTHRHSGGADPKAGEGTGSPYL